MCHTNKQIMNCKNVNKNIISYLEEELTPGAIKEMKMHLQSCEDCSKLLYEMEKTYGMINIEEKAEYDPYFCTHLEARMERELLSKTSTFGRFIPALKYALAIFLIIISISAGALLGSGFRYTNIQNENDNISYVDQSTKDYYMFEMEDELIETVLLNE